MRGLLGMTYHGVLTMNTYPEQTPGDILPSMNAGASTSAVPSPIEGLGHSVGLVGRLGIEPGAPNAYPSPA